MANTSSVLMAIPVRTRAAPLRAMLIIAQSAGRVNRCVGGFGKFLTSGQPEVRLYPQLPENNDAGAVVAAVSGLPSRDCTAGQPHNFGQFKLCEAQISSDLTDFV